MNALHEIKHELHSQDANKAPGEVKCFISIEAMCQELYSVQSMIKAMLNLL